MGKDQRWFDRLGALVSAVGDATIANDNNAHADYMRATARVRKHARWLYRECLGPLDNHARDKINDMFR